MILGKKIAFSLLLSLLSIYSYTQNQIFPTPSSSCISCNGSATFTTDITGSIIYTWLDSEEATIFSETNSTGFSSYDDLCPGVYSIQIEDQFGQITQTIFNIDTEITSNFQATEIFICTNDETYNLEQHIPIDVSNTGIWYNSLNQTINPALNGSPINSNLYYYTLIESGCEVTSAIQLTVNTPASSGLSTTYLICENYPPFLMTDFLGESPDYGGTWLDSNNNVTSEYFDGSIQDTELFTYFIDSVEGCNTVFSTLFVIENLLPNPGIASEITICETAPELNLTDQLDGNPETTGNWLDNNLNAISNIFDPSENEEGIYTYYVNGETPCPTQQAELTINFTPSVSAGTGSNSTLCEDNSIINLFDNLDSYSPGGIFTNEQNEEVSNLVDVISSNSGTYQYSISQEGCTMQSSEIELMIESSYLIGNDTTLTICETVSNYNLNQILEGSFINGDWQLNNTVVSPLIDSSQVPNIFIYSTNNQICANTTLSVEILLDEAPSSGENNSISICQSDIEFSLFDLLINQSNNSGDWIFNNSVRPAEFVPQNDISGNYSYILDFNNECPPSEAFFTIEITDSIVPIELVPIEICGNQSTVQIGTATIPEYTYQWNSENTLSDTTISNPTVGLFSLPIPSNHLYNLEVTSGACQENFSQEIFIREIPETNFNNNISGCSGDEISINIESTDNIFWTPESLFENPNDLSQQIELSESTTLYIETTNQYECSRFDSITINILPTPDVTYSSTELIQCTPASIILENTSTNEIPTEYHWEFSDGNVSNDTELLLSFENPIILHFSLFAISENGCQNEVTSSQPIEIYQQPFANFQTITEDLSIFNPEVLLENNSLFATDYSWSLNSLEISNQESFFYNLPTIDNQNYIFCLEASNNICKDTTCRSVYVPINQTVYVPNTFTPNNDGVNDIFQPIISNINIKDYSLKIFNRWGVLIFESKDAKVGWTGNTNNNSGYYGLNENYVWQLTINQKENLGEQIFKGKVLLIR